MAASTRSSLIPRGFNCFSTIRCRCAAKLPAVGTCWSQPAVEIATQSRYCATIRILPQDNAACAAVKERPLFDTRYRTDCAILSKQFLSSLLIPFVIPSEVEESLNRWLTNVKL
jgi:hypothetical protein